MLIRISLGLPVPDEAGLLIPAVAERIHENDVPAVALVGLYENSVLLQIAGGEVVLLNEGFG